jgi:protein phosphatase
LKWTSSARSDIGRVRTTNEDAWFADDARGVFLVADGMGGHAAGEVASQMATERIGTAICRLRDADSGVDAVKTGIGEAVKKANHEIVERAAREQDKKGMGTTLTTLVLFPSATYVVGQVGDSRAYLLRGKQFQQLTKDHTVVQEQVDRGLLTGDQARLHPLSHILTRALGAQSDVKVDVLTGTAQPGDIFLLASDGLSGMVEDAEMRTILARDPQAPLGAMAEALVEAAKKEGGVDNVTVLLVRILPED